MLIDIDKIVVGDRIRKDFGDIEELADNIKKNGLLNPLTVNGDYKLLAGERRLKACKLLGWSQVDVRMVESEDEAQDIEIELSENNVRRNFTGSELAEGLRRQMAIEAEKARERQTLGETLPEGSGGRARDKAGAAFGISGKQAEKVLFVADNSDLLDPADFADWDDGKLSTNKAYQRIKAAKEQAERERDDARETVSMVQRVADTLKAERDDARAEIDALEKQNDELYELANTQQVVEREVVRNVVPEDYEDMKRRVRELEGSNKLYHEDYQKLRKKNEDMRKKLEQANVLIGEKQRNDSAEWDIAALTTATNNYLRQYGGKAWAFDQFYRVDETTQAEFAKAINNLAAFAQNLAQLIQEKKQLGA